MVCGDVHLMTEPYNQYICLCKKQMLLLYYEFKRKDDVLIALAFPYNM